ncbi:hypothetical protein [Petrimonas mucosa]|uniref:hypothetical protein n=1 Tax=Petrimonas mucosa TaxID=1642646 RepID=UPI00175AA5B3|nr:hypothetical protein [Petrimonas mucosa]HHT28988.1 hypothetical protein [Petrimonas mucosa]
MKTIQLFISMLLCALMAVFSCSSSAKSEGKDESKAQDKPEETKTNYCRVGDREFELTFARMTYRSIDEYFHYYYLQIYEKEADFREGENTGFSTDISSLFCKNDDYVLKSGAYTYKEIYDNPSYEDFKDLTHNGQSDYRLPGSDWNSIKIGKTMTIKVKHHGDNLYEFSWTATDENGLPVEGHYKGEVVE